MNKLIQNSNKILYGILITICIILGLIFNYKVGIIMFGVFHLLMWLNVTITSLCNALVNKEITYNDSLYRIICIIICSVCFAMCFI